MATEFADSRNALYDQRLISVADLSGLERIQKKSIMKRELEIIQQSTDVLCRLGVDVFAHVHYEEMAEDFEIDQNVSSFDKAINLNRTGHAYVTD
jgi:hypothetical protein